MSFRKLLEMTDKIAREELEDYYIISRSRMDNYLDCLESGAEQIATLTAENARLRKREGNATISLCMPTAEDPFNRQELSIIDYGVSDNIYIVERST